jgi:hypothetical protein
MQYYAKAIFAGAMALIGSLGATLAQIGDGAAFGDITTLGWVLIVGTTFGALGGVLGLQAAPASISTSIKA